MVRASISGAGGHGLDPLPSQTKDILFTNEQNFLPKKNEWIETSLFVLQAIITCVETPTAACRPPGVTLTPCTNIKNYVTSLFVVS